jgi:hypothetical protein
VGFVVDKAALGQLFSEYFGFPCQSSFRRFLHHHNHSGLTQKLVVAVSSGVKLGFTPHYINLYIKMTFKNCKNKWFTIINDAPVKHT